MKHIKTKLKILKLCAFPVFLLILLNSCNDVRQKKQEDTPEKTYLTENNEVDIIVLKKTNFKEELISNGKLIAVQKSTLKFEVSGSLQKISVDNGDYIKKNQVIASLKNTKYQQKLDMAELKLRKAELELKDMLIGRGYDFMERDSIPNNIYEMVSIRSGYDEARQQLDNAIFELNSTILTAPFSGKIANVKYKSYEFVDAGAEFVTLINDRFFEVEFFIIESEVDKIEVGGNIQVLAFSTENLYEGKVLNINPSVEKNGTIRIRASIKNDGKLLEGLNVEVRIQKEVPNQYVVPKSTVVLRQNQEVLFKYQNGKTYWTYVNTIHENSNSYSVIANPNKNTAVLEEGDTIIVSDNLNLAHDIQVNLKQ